jgi:hypothetical protein
MSSKAVSSTKISGSVHGGNYAVISRAGQHSSSIYRQSLMSGNRPRFPILVSVGRAAQQQGNPVAAGDGVGDRVEAF